MKRKLHLNNNSLKNKKEGFTLVELLAIIVIITLISSIATYSIIHIINNSKEKSLVITEQNIKKTAATYIKESEDTAWTTTPDNPNEEFSCISIQELINEGYFKENIVKNEALKNKTTDFIIIKRDLNSQTIISEDFDETEKCAANFKYIEQPSCNKNLVYNTTEQTLIPETSYYTFQNNKQTNAGEYNVKVKPNKDVEGNQYVWKNGRTNEVTIKCSISKAETIITLDPTTEIDGQVTFYKTSATPLIKDSNIQENIDGTFTIASSNQEYVKVNQKKIENITIGSKIDINLTAITERKKNTEIKITFTPNNSNYAKSSSIYTLAKTGTTDIYTVTLDANGGNMNNYPTSFKVLANDTYGTALNAIPTNHGYKFTGWYTDPTNGTLKTKDDTTINSNHTLYAHWKESDYTVTLDANGGTVTPNTVTVTYNNNYPNLPTPSNPGYKFEGWYTDPKNGTPITNTTKVTKTSDHIIYAHWSIINYTVSYDANGGSGAPNSQTKTYNQRLTLSSTKPSKTGYIFKNWNTKKDGSGTTYNPGEIYTANSSATLYAQWSIITYTISYNANGGSGAPNSQTKNYGQTLTLSSNKPTKTGYIFKNWNTQQNGSGTNYNPGGSYTTNSSTTLYAIWNPITYTVNYNCNGGSGSTASSSHTYGTARNLTANGCSKTGYYFGGWATSKTGTATYSNQQSVSNLTTTNGATVTLYAKWKPITYKVNYKGNGNTSETYSSNLSNYPNNTTFSSNTLYYDLSKEYDSTFKLVMNRFGKTGYTFQGWATSSTGSKVYNDQQYVSNLTTTNGATVTLYAKWEDDIKPTIQKLCYYKNYKCADGNTYNYAFKYQIKDAGSGLSTGTYKWSSTGSTTSTNNGPENNSYNGAKSHTGYVCVSKAGGKFSYTIKDKAGNQLIGSFNLSMSAC